MQLTSFVVSAILSLALPLFTAAEHIGPSRRHTAIAQRKRGDLQKRAFSGEATWYEVGLGACGQYNGPSDYIVALNTPQYGGGYPGPNCFKSITISAKGKTVNAVIMDQCPGCAYGSLDFSRGLFQYFGDLGEGRFPISWWFNDGSSDPQPAPAPTTTKKATTHWEEPTQWVDPSPWTSWTTSSKKTKSKTPTSTWSETPTPTTTSTWSESPTSTSTAQNTTTSAAEPISSSFVSTSTSVSLTYTAAAAVTSKVSTVPENVVHVNELVLGLAKLIRV